MGSIEEKKSILTSMQKNMRYLLLFCLLFFGCIFYDVYNNPENQKSIQEVRLLLSDVVEQAEHLEIDKLEKYTYYIVDTAGNVMYSNHRLYETGSCINLHELSTGSNLQTGEHTYRFVSPLLDENSQFGTLVVEIPIHSVKINSQEFLLLLLLSLFLLGFIAWAGYCYYRMETRVLMPMNEISDMAVDILNDNYRKQERVFSNMETTRLCENVILLKEEIQEVRKQSKKLSENEKLLLACVSHDLRTPVSTIIGCAECIRDGKAKEEEKLIHYTEIIVNRAMHLSKLFDSILEQTTVEIDKQSISRQEVYARKYMNGILSELLPGVQERGLQMSWNEVPDVLLDIDPACIFRVFQNIIENSVKYTPAGGYIKVQFQSDHQGFAVEISDNGQGIAAVDIPFIFDRFYRGEKARTQKETTGSGLGLSIAKDILECHGTSIECDSVLGQGTTMRFLLPLC